MGRAETFILVTILYVLGYVSFSLDLPIDKADRPFSSPLQPIRLFPIIQCIIASAHHIDQIALGEIVYAFGYTGLQILQQIVIADMTTLRYRLVSSHPSQV